MSQSNRLLTAEELAFRLRVCPETVRNWARRGLIPKVQLSPKVIRYDLEAVVDAVTKRQGHADRLGIRRTQHRDTRK